MSSLAHADAWCGEVTNDAACLLDQDRLGASDIALDGAADHDPSAGDRADHYRTWAERQIPRDSDIALDAAQDF